MVIENGDPIYVYPLQKKNWRKRCTKMNQTLMRQISSKHHLRIDGTFPAIISSWMSRKGRETLQRYDLCVMMPGAKRGGIGRDKKN